MGTQKVMIYAWKVHNISTQEILISVYHYFHLAAIGVIDKAHYHKLYTRCVYICTHTHTHTHTHIAIELK
jgi:hypothetical protein